MLTGKSAFFPSNQCLNQCFKSKDDNFSSKWAIYQMKIHFEQIREIISKNKSSIEHFFKQILTKKIVKTKTFLLL